MAQSAIYEEGVKRLKELNLDKNRFIFKINNESKEINDLVESAIKLLPKELEINKYTKDINTRKSSDGFYMNWHFDDCAIFKHNKNYQFNKNNILLNDKYTLYFSKVPVYTMIIYLSEIDKDFTGGEFNFADKKIKPEKFQVIFFDSKEVHKVNKVKSGERETIIVKFYNKDK
jgi:hypothetical protein